MRYVKPLLVFLLAISVAGNAFQYLLFGSFRERQEERVRSMAVHYAMTARGALGEAAHSIQGAAKPEEVRPALVQTFDRLRTAHMAFGVLRQPSVNVLSDQLTLLEGRLSGVRGQVLTMLVTNDFSELERVSALVQELGASLSVEASASPELFREEVSRYGSQGGQP